MSPTSALSRLIAVASNHPFADGNKRAAFLAVGLFLRRNGLHLTASLPDAARVVLGVASGDREIAPLAEWIRRNSAPAA